MDNSAYFKEFEFSFIALFILSLISEQIIYSLKNNLVVSYRRSEYLMKVLSIVPSNIVPNEPDVLPELDKLSH